MIVKSAKPRRRVSCGKRIYLRGVGLYAVFESGSKYYLFKKGVDQYICSFCGCAIRRGETYVEEVLLGGVVRVYHYDCFNLARPNGLRVVERPYGLTICMEL
jgi:ribosomal protein L24E